MAINFLNTVDLNQNQLDNAVIQNLATAPGSPEAGQIYFDTNQDKLRVWDGAAWLTIPDGNSTANDFLTGLAFNTGSGVLTGTVSNQSNVTVDLDGRYALSSAIPTVNNGTLTMTTGTGLDGAATFSANQAGTSDFAVTLDLTEITLGAGLDSTATGLSLDLSEFTDMTATMLTTDEFIVLDSGAERRKAAGEIGLSIFNNDSNFITAASLPTVSNATITLAAGNILNGGGDFTLNQSASETITFNLATLTGTGQTYGNTSDSIKIDTIAVDVYGRVTGVSTGPTGQVNTVGTGNSNTLTKTGDAIDSIFTPNTGVVNASSANLATGAQIQTAINTALTGVLQFQGTWNASTNSPTLTSSVGTSGDYYIVSVAGNTNLDGITDWEIGDWAVFANTTWTKIDNSQVGDVTGDGAAGRVAFWNSTSNITNDAGFTYNSTSNAFGVSGVITASGGNSGEWNTGYDNSITALNVAGTTTKTLTATQQDGGTLTASWTDNDSGGTVTNIATSGPITGGPITSTGTIGITTASAGTIGAGAVAAGTGISVAYASGIATVTNTQSNSDYTASGTIAAGSLSGTVTHAFGVNTIVQTIDSSGNTVYCDISRTATTSVATISATQATAITILVQKIG